MNEHETTMTAQPIYDETLQDIVAVESIAECLTECHNACIKFIRTHQTMKDKKKAPKPKKRY